MNTPSIEVRQRWQLVRFQPRVATVQLVERYWIYWTYDDMPDHWWKGSIVAFQRLHRRI